MLTSTTLCCPSLLSHQSVQASRWPSYSRHGSPFATVCFLAATLVIQSHLAHPIVSIRSLHIHLSPYTFHSFIMFSKSRSLLPLFFVLYAVVQGKPHLNPQRHQHHSRAVASGSSKIGIVYDSNNNLGAFSGRIGFSVDWSPLPLASSNGLNLGGFIPQLWTFQDSNRESPYRHTPVPY